MIRRPVRVLLATLLTLSAMLVVAAPSHADFTAEVGIEDNRLLLFENVNLAQSTVPRWKNELGVDVVRIQALWDEVAPSPRSFRAPVGFTGFNHLDSRYNWQRLDFAINLVRANGMGVMLTINQKGPWWASRYPFRRNGAYLPDPVKYGNFAYALARRYGTRVHRYLVGNEPNQGIFLAPQNVCRFFRGRRICSRVAPHHYRALVRAAYPRIKAGDTGLDQVVIGEMAPIGGTIPSAPSTAPMIFLREMGCLDILFRRITTGACARFIPARGDAFGYHPYALLRRLRPFQPNLAFRQEAFIGDLRRVFLTMDGVTLRRRILAPFNRFNLYLTEFGYETNPPDPRFGISQQTQSTYLQQSQYIAWFTPRVKNLTQYLFRDDPNKFVGPSNTSFQTGLEFFDGQPKLALRTFPHPFFIGSLPRTVRKRFWGQIKPGGIQTAFLQQSVAGGPFTTIAALRTNFRGYFNHIRIPIRGATYRFTYGGPAGDQFASDGIRVP